MPEKKSNTTSVPVTPSEEKIAQGREGAKAFLEANPEKAQEIEKKIKDTLSKNVVPVSLGVEKDDSGED